MFGVVAKSDLDFRIEQTHQCIFCRVHFSSASDLTDEHAIPLALGGKIVLKKSTCEQCRVETSRFETKVLRGAFYAFRVLTGLPSRSKEAVESLPIFAVDGDEGRRLDIPTIDYPICLPLPRFDRCAILDDGRFGGEPIPPWNASELAQSEVILERYKIASFASMSLDVLSFSRLLAKVAHCLAVRQYGANFTPFLTDIILNDRGYNFRKFIRSVDNTPPEPIDTSTRHRFEICEANVLNFRLIICRLTLFENLGAPTYDIVVGEKGGEFTGVPCIDSEDIVLRDEHRMDNVRVDIRLRPSGEDSARHPGPIDVFIKRSS